MPTVYNSSAITSFQNNLYFSVNNSLFRLKNEKAEQIHAESGFRLQFLSAEGAHLLAGYRCEAGCSKGKVLYFNLDGTFGALSSDCVDAPNYAVEDKQGKIWFGDLGRTFRMLDGVTDASCNNLTFNSPYSQFSRELAIYNNQLWLASGGVNQVFSYRFLDHGFSSFIDGQWTVYNRFNRNELKGESITDANDDLLDFITIAIHPKNGKVYAGSFFEGLIEFNGTTMKLYNDKNSSLNNTVGDPSRTRVSGLAFDEDDNLWVSNHLADRPISVLKADSTWQSFKPSCNMSEPHQVAIDQNGYKWFATTSGSAGLMVFDAGDLANSNDDRCRLFLNPTVICQRIP